jgi:hypothetical protein
MTGNRSERAGALCEETTGAPYRTPQAAPGQLRRVLGRSSGELPADRDPRVSGGPKRGICGLRAVARYRRYAGALQSRGRRGHDRPALSCRRRTAGSSSITISFRGIISSTSWGSIAICACNSLSLRISRRRRNSVACSIGPPPLTADTEPSHRPRVSTMKF